MTIMSIIVTHEAMLNFKPHVTNRSINPSNVSNPRDKTHLKVTLNNIITLKIVTDAQGFVYVMKFLGQAP